MPLKEQTHSETMTLCHRTGIALTSGQSLLYMLALFYLISIIAFYLSEVVRGLISPIALAHPQIPIVTTVLCMCVVAMSFPVFSRRFDNRDYAMLCLMGIGVGLCLMIAFGVSMLCSSEVIFWLTQVLFLCTCLIFSMAIMTLMHDNHQAAIEPDPSVFRITCNAFRHSFRTTYAIVRNFLDS